MTGHAMTQVESMVNHVISEYITHSNARNAQGIANLFCDNAVISDGRQIHTGRQQIIASFTSDMRNREDNYALETEIMDISCSINGLSAVVRERFRVTNGNTTTTGIAIMQFSFWDDRARIAVEIVHETETIIHSEI